MVEATSFPRTKLYSYGTMGKIVFEKAFDMENGMKNPVNSGMNGPCLRLEAEGAAAIMAADFVSAPI